MSKPFEVRDLRQKEKFVVDDMYMNGYAKLFSPAVSMVYFNLCRRADKHQEAFPSVERMASDLGINERTVRRAIRQLENACLVYRVRVRGPKSKWSHTQYQLIDKKEWCPKEKLPDILSSGKSYRTLHTQPTGHSVPKATGHQSPTKETQRSKETHIKDTRLLPSSDTPYGNQEIQSLLDELTTHLETPLDGTVKENRQYAWNLLRKLKKFAKDNGRPESQAIDIGKFVIQAAHKGWHSKNATSMKYIYYNMGKIVKESKGLEAKVLQL